MTIRPVGVDLYHADRQTDMTKLIDSFRSFANAPNKRVITWISRLEVGHGAKRKGTKLNLFSNRDQYLPSEPRNLAHIYGRVDVVTLRLTSQRPGNVMSLSDLQSPWTLLMVRVQCSPSSYHMASSLASCILRTTYCSQ